MLSRISIALPLIFVCCSVTQAMDLREAVQAAVTTNPDVLEASANRRARNHELRAAQGAFLPSLTVSGDFGAQRLDRPNSFTQNNNDKWRTRKELAVTVEQLLFDGFSSVNEVYRQASRIDAAALRVMQRSDARALDAVEAYIDVIRHTAILSEAHLNVARHKKILSDVRERYQGGETGAADLSQATERVAASEIVVAEIRKSLLDTTAKFRRVVGQEPTKLKAYSPAIVPNGPVNRLVNLAATQNPEIRAALADAKTAEFEFKQTKSLFAPRVSIQGIASVGDDLDGIEGRNNDYTAKLVFSWKLYNGGSDTAQRREYGEQFTQAQIAVDRVRRDVKQAIEQTWASVITQREKISAIRKQLAANEKVVDGYAQEYSIGQRTLLDLLNAENSLFNNKIDLLSAQAIYSFSTYELKATTGDLLAYLDVQAPAEATGIDPDKVSIFPSASTSSFYVEPLRKF